ncbi:MAG: hypothetical protein P1V36_07485 [Planctomycetota bacterium]|nr:hypothetical protein [Planctomycetota bacterium]
MSTVTRLGLAAALILGLAAFLAVPDARAHGGRYQGKPPKPGDGGPRPPPRPPPPPPPPFRPPPTPPRKPRVPPTTPRRGPGDSVPVGRTPTAPRSPRTPRTPTTRPPTPTTPTTGTPGRKPTRPTTRRPTGVNRRRPGATAGSADATWEMWWELNRWTFFPARGVRWAEPKVAITPRDPSEGPIDRDALARERRTLVVRQHIVPFLLRQLAPETDVRPEVRAAAMIALGKVSHDEAAVALIVRHMQDKRAPNVVRESGAYALGLLRRTDASLQMDGTRLDTLRTTLLGAIDDAGAPARTRAFAAFSLGLLGDQPYGSAFTKDGRMLSRALWERAVRKYSARDIPVALLTALGRLPAAGTSKQIKEGLQRIVLGRRVGKRSWDTLERSHALDALVRQRGAGWQMTLLRTITDKRLPAAVQRAAFIALGAASADLTDADRVDAAEATERGIRLARDGLTRGLGHIALGRLLGADLASEKAPVAEQGGARGLLISEARHGSNAHRGFSALALALAIRGTTAATVTGAKFQIEGRSTLARGFEREKDPVMRSAYVVALGLLGPAAKAHSEDLTALVLDRSEDPELRGHAALTLAQFGTASKDTRTALRSAAWDKRSVGLRRDAALALSFLGGGADSRLLVREMRTAKSRWILSQVAVALGQLGDLAAVPAVLALAGDEKREDEARALAIASLGLLGDPEEKPSTLRLTSDSNYPARTDALHEAFTLL